MNKTFFIIADDFTGANDSGVQIAKQGITTHVVLDAKGIQTDGSSYVLDTESRNIDGELAKEKVRAQLEYAKDFPFDHIIKKLDSTLRGNVAEELKAADEILQPDLIIFAPAFPEIGRTTKNGIHMLNGIPIHETEIARDPIKPVTNDSLSDMLKTCFSSPIYSCGLEELRYGQLSSDKAHIYCFDIETREDLDMLVSMVLKWDKKVLWAGSAGIAGSLLKQTVKRHPVLAAVGSISDVSREQVLECEKQNYPVISIDIACILNGSSWESYAQKTIDLLQKGHDVVIATAYDRADYENAIQVGQDTCHMTKEDVSRFTQEILAKIILFVGTHTFLGGLFLTGGDTAIGLIHLSGAFGSTIKQEIATGVPLMLINGGTFHGLPIVTKAGAFGTSDTIIQCIQRLKEV